MVPKQNFPTFKGMVEKENIYGAFTFCKKYIPGKNLVLNLWAKILSANEISVFFNRQYFINELISDFNFLNVDRNR